MTESTPFYDQPTTDRITYAETGEAKMAIFANTKATDDVTWLAAQLELQAARLRHGIKPIYDLISRAADGVKPRTKHRSTGYASGAGGNNGQEPEPSYGGGGGGGSE